MIVIVVFLGRYQWPVCLPLSACQNMANALSPKAFRNTIGSRRPSEHIVNTPGICGGRACIVGHRIRVADIVVWLNLFGVRIAKALVLGAIGTSPKQFRIA